jgi:hypothetical protein
MNALSITPTASQSCGALQFRNFAYQFLFKQLDKPELNDFNSSILKNQVQIGLSNLILFLWGYGKFVLGSSMGYTTKHGPEDMKNLNVHFKMINTKYLHGQKIDLPGWCTCNIYETPHFEGNCTVGNPLVTPNKTCLVYDITRYCQCWWQSCRPYPSKLLYHT